ncbi:MAG: hypothetical protein GQ574_19385 [Crocinitomix sp.]|nr:hypothetical protein [Crocinitomix sp.]
MALIQQLQNFNLDLTKLHELSEQDLIRIEKKFKAEIRLNDSLDMNDLEQVIYVLKHHQQDMIWLMTDELKLLKSILTNPQKFIVKKGEVSISTEIDRTAFSLFLENYFDKELRQYVDKCIKNDFYNAIHSLLKFQALLTPQLLNELQNKLANKLNYAVECIDISASDISRKVSYCTNPFFYRVLSQLGSGQYESDIVDLLNTTISKLKTKELHWAIVFAMGSFAAQGEGLKDTLRGNKSTAFQRGVRETKVNRITGRATGGATSSGEPLPRDPKAKASKSGNYVILFVIAIIISIVFSISKCQRKNRISDNFIENRWAPVYESDPGLYEEDRVVIEDNQNDLRQKVLSELDQKEVTTDLSREANSFEAIINYLHSNDAQITEVREIPFNIDSTELNKGPNYNSPLKNIKLVNLLGERLVVQSRTLHWNRYHIMEPNATITISHKLKGLKFYVGNDPVLVDYIDEYGQSQSHFMFDQVTEEQLDDFNNFHNLSQYFDDKEQYEILLTYMNSEIELEVSQK